MSKNSGGRQPSQRGNSSQTINILIAALSTIPGATYDELHAHSGLSYPTIAAALKRIATAEPNTWPRRWHLNADVHNALEAIQADQADLPILTEVINEAPKKIPTALGWKHWAQVCMTWPDGIGRLSRSDDPREISKALASIARTAAALSLVFASVQDEPDWAQRIGARPQE